MSKIVKGVGKAAKKVFSGIKKVFKKIWETPIGKIVLIAAAVYFGGVLIQGLASAGGAAGSAAIEFNAAATLGVEGAAAGGLGAIPAAGSLGGGVAATGGGIGLDAGAILGVGSTASPSVATAGPAALGSTGGTIAADVAAAKNYGAAATAANKAALGSGGIPAGVAEVARNGVQSASDIFGKIRGLAKGVIDYAGEHEVLSLGVLGAVAGGLQPTEAESIAIARRLDREQKSKEWSNYQSPTQNFQTSPNQVARKLIDQAPRTPREQRTLGGPPQSIAQRARADVPNRLG